jgi:hypothetical protein
MKRTSHPASTHFKVRHNSTDTQRDREREIKEEEKVKVETHGRSERNFIME